MFELLVVLAALGFVYIAHRLTRGRHCAGDCRQGRQPCNCKDQ